MPRLEDLVANGEALGLTGGVPDGLPVPTPSAITDEIDAAVAAQAATDSATYAAKPATANAVQWVTALGNDANDGLSWGTAKATVAAAQTALPAAGGEILLGGGNFALSGGAVGWTWDTTKPTWLAGAGRAASSLTYAGTGVAIKIDGTGTDPNDWGGIDGVEVHCTALAATTAIALTHVHRGHLKDVYCLGNNYAANSRGLVGSSAFGNYVDDSVFAGFDVPIDLVADCHDFTIDNTNLGGKTTTLRVKDSKDVRVRGGQHSGTGATIGHTIIATAAGNNSCSGLQILEVHYEGNALDLALGRTADGSDTAVLSPTIATPFPNGATLDRANHPLLVNPRIGIGTGAPALTLTANCIYPVILGLSLAAGATLSDASGSPSVMGDINGRVGVGTLSPGARFHVAGGDLLLDNNTSFRYKDSVGTARRLSLLSGSNAIYFGDVDNAMNSDLLMLAGGTGIVKMMQNGNQIASARAGGFYVEIGNLRVLTAGQGVAIKEGANAKMGVATLVAGTVTVANTSVTANSRIHLTIQSLGTVADPKPIAVTAKVNGTSFTIRSADATDTSVVAWEILEAL